jgi:RNA-directed DNA polymerase
MTIIIQPFDKIFSFESLFESWKEFNRGKKSKDDVALYTLKLIDNLKNLYNKLQEDKYHHDGYHHFKISDPKSRDIHKASVKDRIIHHALYRALYFHFDRTFIHDSYSCRIGKGTHKALIRFKEFSRKVSQNHTKTVWVLKCDIRKCFASIDQQILKNILTRHVECRRTFKVIDEVIDSFSKETKVGIPLGNLTSQLFVNVYLNSIDHFVKRILKIKHYIRYADDMVFFSREKSELELLIPPLENFLHKNLKLALHPKKVEIKTIASGVDFLGYVFFPNHVVLRTSTKKRMLKRITKFNFPSYASLLCYCNGKKIENSILHLVDSDG